MKFYTFYKISEENKILKQKYKDLENSLESHVKLVDQLKGNTKPKQEIMLAKIEVCVQTNRIEKLEKNHDELEQYTQKCNL